VAGRLSKYLFDNSIYKLDFDNQTMKLIGKLKNHRRNHSIVYLNGNIYVIGGDLINNAYTTSCEMLDIASKKVCAIANANFGVIDPSLCSF